MAVIEIAKIQVRRGQELQTGVPQLDPGEFGWAQDTQHLYIGKRIAEGANSDENTRILTDNDLENIFQLIEEGAVAGIYKYRATKDYINSVQQTVSQKLDNWVSITDYGVVPFTPLTGDYLDITEELQTAVENLFNNYENRRDARKKLLIPSGVYVVTEKVELPPYTVIEGEGPGLTKIIFRNTTTSLFQTIDEMGNDFASGNMQSGAKRSREVVIRGMTLEYDVGYLTDQPLVRLDNVLNAVIENVEFSSAVDISTGTFGLVSDGVGLSVRGTGGGIQSGDANLCENVQVINSKFERLQAAVEITGTVVRSLISNSIFNNLENGVKLYSIDNTLGPSNSYILENRFQNITKEGIFVGTQTNHSQHVSEKNFFIQVGNGTTLDDTTSSEAYAVISFNTPGNKSINDYFYRQIVANSTNSLDFYYNPLVTGAISIVNDSVFEEVNLIGNTNHGILKLPLTGREQKVDIDYKIYDNSNQYSRTGKLLINISKPGTTEFVAAANTFTAAGNTVINLFTITQSGTTLRIGDILSSPALATNTEVVAVGANQVTIDTPSIADLNVNDIVTATTVLESYGSISDYYNYSYTEEWDAYNFTLGPDPEVAVFSLTEPYNNYIELKFNNWTTKLLNLEYQISKNT